MLGEAVDRISSQLIATASTGAINLGASSSFESMRAWCRLLYEAVGDNLRTGHFFPGQQVMTPNELESLLPVAAQGPVRMADMDSREGDPSFIRKRYDDEYQGINDVLRQAMFERVHALRTSEGAKAWVYLKAIRKHDIFTPPSSLGEDKAS